MVVASILQLFLKNNRIKFILSTHYHIEDWNQDSHAWHDHADKQQRLRFKLVLGLWYNDQLEEDVDGQLWEVLREERYETH